MEGRRDGPRFSVGKRRKRMAPPSLSPARWMPPSMGVISTPDVLFARAVRASQHLPPGTVNHEVTEYFHAKASRLDRGTRSRDECLRRLLGAAEGLELLAAAYRIRYNQQCHRRHRDQVRRIQIANAKQAALDAKTREKDHRRQLQFDQRENESRQLQFDEAAADAPTPPASPRRPLRA